MELTFKECLDSITAACLRIKSCNPVEIFRFLAAEDFVRMHGPEHHLVNGACLLTAFYNAGGDIDLEAALLKLAEESVKMPGAMCGIWGVCGAATSIGCALAIIDGTGPLSADGTWGSHMQLCGDILRNIAATKGPRCCKRDGMLAIIKGAEYINSHYTARLETNPFVCEYYHHNKQCISSNCPFWRK